MRVLIGTDGSAHARAAVESLLDFPLPPAASIKVLSVATLPHAPVEVQAIRAFNRALREAAWHAAEEARARLATRWSGVEADVRDGDPRQALVREAVDWPADLVVLGARGLGGVKAFLLGSVSRSVAREAPCPVLVVRGEPQPLRRAVVAVDGSADSVAALRVFAALPLPPDLRVRLLAVAAREPVPMTAPEMITAPLVVALDPVTLERRRQLEDVLVRLQGELGGRVAAVEPSVVVGDPAGEILAAAAEPGVDLVVVGARGRGTLARLVLGSVSEHVLHHASCSVLVVKSGRTS